MSDKRTGVVQLAYGPRRGVPHPVVGVCEAIDKVENGVFAEG